MKNLYQGFVVACLMLLGNLQSYAQVNITRPDTTICPGSSVTLNATIGSSAGNFLIFTDDIFSPVIPIGFNFTFYGNTYSSLVLSSNGFLTFDQNYANQGSEWDFTAPGGGAIPGNQYCLNSVMGPYMDIDPSAGGSIEYSVQGTAPNRRFQVTYCTTPMYNCFSQLASFQIVLFETTNNIEIHISNKPACTSWNGSDAIEGIQNATGTAAVVVPGRNYPTNWTASSSSHRFTPSGSTYTVSSIPFAFFPTGLNNINWYKIGSSASIGSGTSITVTPTANSSYRAVATGCIGSSSDTVDVITANNVTAPTIVSPISYCQGGNAVPLTAGGTNLRWYTQPTGGVGSTVAPTPNTSTPGTFTWYVSQIVGGCEGPRSQIDVVITPTTAPVINVNSPVCTSDTLKLSTTPVIGATYTWSGPNSFSSGLANPIIPNVQAINAGTYTLSIAGNGCQSPVGSATVTISPSPAAPVAGGNTPICAGTDINLTASNIAGATYAWAGPNAFSSTLQNPTITAATTAASGIYSVRSFSGGCYSQPGIINITVNNAPAAPVTTPTTYCQFAVATPLTATGQNLLWYTQPAGGTGTSAAPVPNTGIAGNTTWYVSQTVNGCEGPRAPIQVTVFAQPPVPAVSDIFYCQDAPSNALTATGQNLKWYTQPSGGTGSTIAPIPSTVVPGTFTWYVSQTIDGCEGPRSSITVTIGPKPSIPVATTTAYSYCQFDASVTLSATGQDLLWYTQPVGGTGSTIAPTPSTSLPGTFTYYVTQTITCESNRLPITVTVFEKPALPIVSDIAYCNNDISTPLTAIGQNLLWYANATGGTGSTTAPTPSTSIVAITTFYVSQSINGCEGDRAPINVTINPQVFAQIVLDTNYICVYDTLNITSGGTNPANAQYIWDFDGVAALSGSGAGPYLAIWNVPGSKNITLVVSNGVCADTTAAQLTVNEAPNADFVLQDHTCIDDTVFVQASWDAQDAQNYTWNFGDAQVINGSGPGYYKVRWNTPGLKAITLVTDNGGCKSAVITEGIIVHEAPAAQINVSSTQNICAGDIIEVSAVNLGDGYSYDWSPVNFFNGYNGAVSKVKILRSGNIYLTVQDQYGCPGRDSIFIAAEACCNITVPTAFTPNNDGINDRFGIITDGNNELISFRIMNRWGQTIFETLNPGNKWDGTFMNTPQPLDNYHYYIKYKCGDGTIKEKKGELTLLR